MYPDRAARYRERAEELRVIAEDWNSDETRLMLRRIALDYERLAAGIEQVASAPEPRFTPANDLRKSEPRRSAEYQFRLRGKNGALLLQYAQLCTSDEDALRIPGRLFARRDRRHHLEIWQDDRCLYDGTPAGWPIAPPRSPQTAH